MPYLIAHSNNGKPSTVSQECRKYKLFCFSKWIFSGVGYHIDIVKEPHCDVEEIAKIIYYHIPIATLEKNARNELSFILPKDYTHRYGFREC